MGSVAGGPEGAGAFGRIGAELDGLLSEDWVPSGCEEAMVRVRAVESLSRRFHALQVEVLDRVDRLGVFKADGHASAKVMVRHGANLSNVEALRRDQAVKVLRAMPVLAAAHRAGRVGTPQVERIARTFANRRVREQLVAVDEQIARLAAVWPYREFDAALTDWERLVDEDGAGDRAERTHASRDFRMPRNFDGSHRFDGGGGSVDGAVIDDIWQRQVRREWDADWAAARARLGDAATPADLARTDAQRR